MEISISTAALVAVVMVFLQSQRQQRESENVYKTLSEHGKRVEKAMQSSPAAGLEERVIIVERRMAMLEEDAKTILARASTRLRRAKDMSRKAGDLDDGSEESEEPESENRPQFQLPFNGHDDSSEEDQLELVKAAMRSR